MSCVAGLKPPCDHDGCRLGCRHRLQDGHITRSLVEAESRESLRDRCEKPGYLLSADVNWTIACDTYLRITAKEGHQVCVIARTSAQVVYELGYYVVIRRRRRNVQFDFLVCHRRSPPKRSSSLQNFDILLCGTF